MDNKNETILKIVENFGATANDKNNNLNIAKNFVLQSINFIDNFNKKILQMHEKILKSFNNGLFKTFKDIDINAILCAEKLYRIGWMPCIDLDEGVAEKIVNELIEIKEENINNVVEIIFKNYSDKKLDCIYESWEKNSYLNRERLTFLKEGIENYKEGKYASCVTLMVCNYGGIIEETDNYIKSIPKLKEQLDSLKKMQKRNKMNLEKKNYLSKKDQKIINGSEKYKSERIYLMKINYITCIFSKYIKEYVYCDSKKAKDNIPNRHGICHGSLFNYNTKEHALKSILIMDSLIRMYLYLDLEECEESDAN